ncbi:hypothetical protein PAXRUDRAFT_162673 [Paxillus rubicundulus Ve08.2h10]|uniref:Uncharacterized protein n=1 Tax=Paxillus rubicundulus Ve08.2h10 TaxID=930991 RepID=A0A0D0DDS8_9AGAM|nr:hypothetical protein PAXRUDRAFT_162673 [Paxillus rubicundulus Ve08.2h10]
MSCCDNIWVSTSSPSMPGHAFWVGGYDSATELLLQGINPDIVATQGFWKSQAFLEYWCHIESILPLFISSSSSTSHALSLDTTMTNFSHKHCLQITCSNT